MSIRQNNSNILMGFLAFLVAFPIIVVFSAWLLPGTELWGHFSENLHLNGGGLGVLIIQKIPNPLKMYLNDSEVT